MMLLDTHGPRTFTLREYQHAAIEALLSYFETSPGNPIVAVPTGGGKTAIMGGFIRRVLDQWPRERFLIVSHVKELLVQDAAAVQRLVPRASVGIYSAGLKRRELGAQITVAGIQSVHRKAHQMGDVSMVLIDECHLCGRGGDTMYLRFLSELRQFCPHVRIVGMSATPYRLDSGSLIKGEDRIFTDIAYSISIRALIEQGYLAPLRSAPTAARLDAEGVKRRGGEYVAGDLERAVNRTDVTGPALDEVVRLCADRRSWLVFCVGVRHATDVVAALKERSVDAAAVTRETTTAERDAVIERFKRGDLRALVSVNVLSTGFDAPNVDAIVCLRPTLSPGLWVQAVGRGARLHPAKADCLVADFTDNTRRHGPIDLIEVDRDGTARTSPMVDCLQCMGDVPRRASECPHCGAPRSTPCPQCGVAMVLGEVECLECGYVKPEMGGERAPRHATQASDAPILSDGSGAMSEAVASWSMARHRGKGGKPDSMRVEYRIDQLMTYQEWICFEHGGWAAQKAAVWWVRHGGTSPAPTAVGEALRRAGELKMPATVRVKREGKYWRVEKTSYAAAS